MRVLRLMEDLLAIEAEEKYRLASSDRSHEQTLMPLRELTFLDRCEWLEYIFLVMPGPSRGGLQWNSLTKQFT